MRIEKQGWFGAYLADLAWFRLVPRCLNTFQFHAKFIFKVNLTKRLSLNRISFASVILANSAERNLSYDDFNLFAKVGLLLRIFDRWHANKMFSIIFAQSNNSSQKTS